MVTDKQKNYLPNNNTMAETTNNECSYKKGDEEPCATCPRKITTLYMCKFLQDTLLEENEEESEEKE